MTYAERVRELEAEGMTTSDAQSVAEAEILTGERFDHPRAMAEAAKRPIYLYRIEWADVRPQQTVEREPIIAGGMHDAREVRRFFEIALRGSFSRSKGVRGQAIIRRVRRIGLDTPSMRDAIGAGL